MSLLDDASPHAPIARRRPGRATTDLRTVLGKAFTMLEAFGGERETMSLTELSRRTGLTVPTVHRLANQLVELGALTRTSRGQLRPGRHLFELGQGAGATAQLVEAAQRPMQDLYEMTHQTIHLAILDGTDIVIISRFLGRDTPALTRVGVRKPAHATALGKALLAVASTTAGPPLRVTLSAETPATVTNMARFCDQMLSARRAGFAHERDEAILGYSCVAAPIVDRRGRAVAAMSIMAPTETLPVGSAGQMVRDAAKRAAAALGSDWEP